MMKVMELRAVEKRQMIAAMISEGGNDCYREPNPARW